MPHDTLSLRLRTFCCRIQTMTIRFVLFIDSQNALTLDALDSAAAYFQRSPAELANSKLDLGPFA